MSDLLVPPLAVDKHSQAIDALSARMTNLDLTPLLVYMIDLVPADVLPFLAQQFNVVGPLWAYLPDDAARRNAIQNSVAWHRAKGTPWAVETALSWAGHTARVEDQTGTTDRWAEYQLEFSSPIGLDDMQEVIELARFAAPARSHLARLYGGYDLRSVGLSGPQALDVGLLSDDSGVWIDGIKLSFGATHTSSADISTDHAVSAIRTDIYSDRVYYEDRSRLSAWQLDSELVLNHPIVAGQLITLGNSVGLADPQSLATRQTIARAALVLSDDHEALGNENARFAGYAEIEHKPFELSGSALSDHDNGLQRIPLDVMNHAMTAFAPSPLDPQEVYGPAGREEVRSLFARRIQQETGWRGRWDARRWRADVIGISITHEGA